MGDTHLCIHFGSQEDFNAFTRLWMLMFWGDTRMVVYLFAAKGLKEQQLSYTKTTLNKQPAALKQLRQYRPGKFGREISDPPHFNLMRNEEVCPPQHLKLSHEGGEGTRVAAEKNESDEQTIPSSLGSDGNPHHPLPGSGYCLTWLPSTTTTLFRFQGCCGMLMSPQCLHGLCAPDPMTSLIASSHRHMLLHQQPK